MHKTIRAQLKTATSVIFGGATAWAAYSLCRGDERFYRQVAMPVMCQLVEPETAHRLAVFCCRWNLLPKLKLDTAPCLRTSLCGRPLSQPVGLAAGFDKDADGVPALFQLGFSTVEIGSVTPLPQPGNEQPRVFRLLAEQALINRYGFNSAGHDYVAQRLASLEAGQRGSALLGVNLGKNRVTNDHVEDYAQGVRRLGKFADYLVINVSSPNTPGLRALQGADELRRLLLRVRAELNLLSAGAGAGAAAETAPAPRPSCLLFVKLAPELVQWSEQEVQDIVKVFLAEETRVDGLIVSNTTLERPDSLTSASRHETGGLSGAPVEQLSTSAVHRMYAATNGALPIIGCGGVSSGAAAFRKIAAGASAVQLYTALAFQGPPVLARVCRELHAILEKEGFSSVEEAVGCAHRNAVPVAQDPAHK